MKKITLPLAFLFLFLACGQNPQTGNDGWTANESRATEAIKTAYGGKAVFSKTTPTEGGKNYFHAELSESPVIEEQIDLTGMFASHIAWLCFENLPDSATRPQGIAVTVKLSTGETPVFDYPIRELESVKNALPILEKTVALLKAADYEGLVALHSPDRLGQTAREDLVRDCSSLDTNNGRVKDFQFQGFAFFAPSSGASELLHLAGLLKRESYDTPLSVIIDPAAAAAASPVYQINFDY